MRINLNISLYLIAFSVFACLETANAQEDLLKKYFGNEETYNHGDTLRIKAKDAKGFVDSVEIIIHKDATFNIDSNLDEVNIIKLPKKKDLDLRLVRKSTLATYLPNEDDSTGIKCWLFNSKLSEKGKSIIASISSNEDLETKIEYIPTHHTAINNIAGVPSTNFVLQLNAVNFPVELYIAKSRIWMVSPNMTRYIYDTLSKQFNHIGYRKRFNVKINYDEQEFLKYEITTILDIEESKQLMLINDALDGVGVENDVIQRELLISYQNKSYKLQIPKSDFQIDNKLTLEFYNYMGELIKEYTIEESSLQLEIQIDDIEPNIYFVRNNFNLEITKLYLGQ